MGVMKMLFGNYSKRELKRIQPICDQVLALEDKYKAMSDSELQAQTPALKERLAKGETLDDILPDAFAACREASARVLGMRHFPVQIIGGIALHKQYCPIAMSRTINTNTTRHYLFRKASFFQLHLVSGNGMVLSTNGSTTRIGQL